MWIVGAHPSELRAELVNMNCGAHPSVSREELVNMNCGSLSI